MRGLVIAGCAAALGGCSLDTLVADSACQGPVGIYPDDHVLTEAALHVRAAYPTAFHAQQFDDPPYIDAHPQDFVGHSELEGFGVTFVQAAGPTAAVHCADGALDRPSLLFFDKRAGNDEHRDWPIIGMGYHYEWGEGCRGDNGDGDQDFDDGATVTPCSRPFILGLPAHAWIVHEAGYHELGSGDFVCVTNDDIKTDGLIRDASKCNLITKDDMKKKIGPVAHGRAWAAHVFFDPETGRPTIATTDPWCRQSGKARSVGACAFKVQSEDCCP